MNKRDTMLELIRGGSPPAYVPAAFFMHFDADHHAGPAAVEQHLAFFRATGMDFVKVQYEQGVPAAPPIERPADWARAPRVGEEWFEPTVRVVEGLARAAGGEALVVVTVYSPFMWATHSAPAELVGRHLREDPEAVRAGLEIFTENVAALVRACRRAGADGFYVSTQGGEAFRFAGTEIFERYVKPTDLAVWDAAAGCDLNILHVCDYVGPYDDLAPFVDYPGHVVNCSLAVGGRELTPAEGARLFGRPFMGGMERLGALAGGDVGAIQAAAERALAAAPERFVLAADCTIPSATPWEHVRAAVDVAHGWRG